MEHGQVAFFITVLNNLAWINVEDVHLLESVVVVDVGDLVSPVVGVIVMVVVINNQALFNT